MDRIIIWGSGIKGQSLCNHILTYWDNDVEVVGYVDSNSELINKRIKNGENYFTQKNCRKNIYGVQDLITMYQEGQITGCLIAVAPNQCDNDVVERQPNCDYYIPDNLLSQAIKNAISMLENEKMKGDKKNGGL